MKMVLLIMIMLSVLDAEILRNDHTKVVKDTTLNLEWEDDKVTKNLNYKEAIKYCANLSLRGSGWKLPTQEQLRSIVDKTNFYPSIASAFTQTTMRDSNSMYWSSTIYEFNKDAAWLVGFWGGGDHYSTMKYKANVRCVRKVQ